MPSFRYEATNGRGQAEHGTVLSPSLAQAVEDLAARGLNVTRIDADPSGGLGDLASVPAPARAVVEGAAPTPPSNLYDYEEGAPSPFVSSVERPGGSSSPETAPRSYFATSIAGPLVGRVPLAQLNFFFRQFAAMQKAGVPIVQALDTLAGQAQSPKLRRVIGELREHAKAGRPLSAGAQRYPEVFTPMAVSLIRAGEESGRLDESCMLISDYLQSEIELRSLLRRVTFYPKLLLGFSILIVLSTNYIIQNVLAKEGGLSSPLTMASTWIILAPTLIGIFLFVRWGLANPRIKYNWDLFLSVLPYMGGTLRQLAMAKFGRAFSALWRGGIPMTRAIELSADACGNEYLRARIYPAAKRLESGAGLTETLRETGAFSPIVLDMTATGETTGNLDEMLTKMCEYYEDEGKTRAHAMGQLLGLLTLVGVAIYIVAMIVLPFWLGYYGGLQQQME